MSQFVTSNFPLRRRKDSNLRSSYPDNTLARCRFRPLSHASNGGRISHQWAIVNAEISFAPAESRVCFASVSVEPVVTTSSIKMTYLFSTFGSAKKQFCKFSMRSDFDSLWL